ncbi:MAG: tetratricopeptide repeat protein [Deltaproteobacteria bacterium]|nr:tetratricopeptide repeat protein [Deltaproteobacteria bacterium]
MRSSRGSPSRVRQRGPVGRDRELAQVRAAWDSGARLITAWGPGGSGKSCLIRHFAAWLASAKAPIAVRDLSDARDTSDLRRKAAEVLPGSGPKKRSSKPARKANPTSAILLVDGLDRIGRDGGELIREWLDAQLPLRVLATSREALWLPEEQRVEVGPLGLAEGCELLMREARDACGARAEEWLHEPALERIVDGVDALPLSLEIVAAQLALLSPKELESRLSQQLDMAPVRAPHPGHESLRAVVDESWSALSASEQMALMRLSVCSTTMAVEMAEQLLQSDARDRPLRVIESLRRRAMLRLDDQQQGGTRLRLYSAVRLFAGQALAETDGWDRVHEAFAKATLWQMERAAADARTRADANAMARLRSEEANGQSAYAWYRGRAPEEAGRVALALQEIYRVHGPFPAQIDLLTEAIAGLPASGSFALGTQLLVARAELLRLCGHAAEAAADLSVVIAAPETDVPGKVEAQRLLGTVQRMRGELSEALDSKRKALQMARQARLRSHEARCLGDLGTIHAALGQLHEAARHHRAALDLHRRVGDLAAEGVELSNLGVATHRLGHMQQAREIHEQAVAIHRKVGNRRSEAGDLCHLAFVLHQMGKLAEADPCFESALRVCMELGDRQLAAVVKTWWGDLLTEMGRETQSAVLLQEALGFHEAAEDARLQAIAHLHLAHAYRAAGRLTDAVDELHAAISAAPPAQAPVLALSHAYLARLLEGSPRIELAATHRREALSLLGQVPSPLTVLAVSLLAGQDQEGKLPMSLAEASGLSSDVRRALAWTVRAQPDARTLVVGGGCQWVALGKTRVELGRRKSLRLIVACLVEERLQHPGKGLPCHRLTEAGWPGEKMSVEAAQKRVYTAMWTLRKEGLERIVTTTQDGYLIDPSVEVRRR